MSGIKTKQGWILSAGSCTVLGFWRAGNDELLESLEEEVLEDILNQIKISEKLKKIGNKVLTEKPNG